jgi:hypothetical protein
MTQNGKLKLSVFKGREAKLNRAILLILARESPLNMRQVYKRVRTYKDLSHTRYRVVNRRMKLLKDEGLLEQVRVEKMPQGFVAKLYQLNVRACLALTLEHIDLDEFIRSATESEVISVLTSLLGQFWTR